MQCGIRSELVDVLRSEASFPKLNVILGRYLPTYLKYLQDSKLIFSLREFPLFHEFLIKDTFNHYA